MSSSTNVNLARSTAFLGNWVPPSMEDSNIRFTVLAQDDGLQVTAVDVFDGEVLEVSGIQLHEGDRQVLRFSTYTPSTDATLDHELVALPSGKIRHSITERADEDHDDQLAVRAAS